MEERKGIGYYGLMLLAISPVVLGLPVKLGIHIWKGGNIQELGERYTVNEEFRGRVFCRREGRFFVDKDRDGKLDEVLINIPISPMLGGPGWAFWKDEIIDQDRMDFERANYLFNSRNGGSK